MSQKPNPKEIWAVRGLLAASIIAAAAGIAAFIFLFLPDYNIYWLMLTPIILAFYIAPAAFLFRKYRRKKQAISGQESDKKTSLKKEKDEKVPFNSWDH